MRCITNNIFHIIPYYCTNFSRVIILIFGVLVKNYGETFHSLLDFFSNAKLKILNEYLLIGPTQRKGETSQAKLLSLGCYSLKC